MVTAASGQPVLNVEDLERVYGDGPQAHVAIRGMSFTVQEGEFVTIVGPSGCGKTTLLKCISGLIPVTSGEVRFSGERITAVPERMGFVFQEYSRSLFPWLTVQKNVAFPLDDLPEDERRSRVGDSLAAVGLDRFADRYPSQLSGGMQQRVAIARALAYRPSVMLMDEPFGSVDAYTRAELEDLILRVRDHYGMTIVLVTHDIDESVYLGDRILVLSGAPARVVDTIAVALPRERDQVHTPELPAFIETRARVARGIFGQQKNPVPVNGGGE